MKSIRMAVGILSILLISNTCPLVVAQDAAPFADAKVCLADPPHEGLQPLVRGTDPAPAAPAPDGEGCTTPFVAQSPGECFNNGAPPVCVPPPCCNACPCFYAQFDVLFLMQHHRTLNQPMVVDPNTGATLLQTSDLDYDVRPGVQTTVGMRIFGNTALEFTYFGLFDSSASQTVTAADPAAFLIFPDNLAGNVFVDMDRVQTSYSSRLNSFEANLPCCCGCCETCPSGCGQTLGCGTAFDEGGCGCGQGFAPYQTVEWFGGFRYINVDERLNTTAQTNGGAEEGTYNVRTTNNLYGVQLGGRVRRMGRRFGGEAGLRGGIFANDAQQSQSVTDFPNFPLRPNMSSNRTDAAFVGQANITGLYRLTNAVALRAGYTVLWIEGLALAPDQLDYRFATSPSGDQLHNGGAIILHGATVGIEARW